VLRISAVRWLCRLCVGAGGQHSAAGLCRRSNGRCKHRSERSTVLGSGTNSDIDTFTVWHFASTCFCCCC